MPDTRKPPRWRRYVHAISRAATIALALIALATFGSMAALDAYATGAYQQWLPHMIAAGGLITVTAALIAIVASSTRPLPPAPAPARRRPSPLPPGVRVPAQRVAEQLAAGDPAR